ncbi:MAG: RNA polymerase sigma factor, partial [Gemmataceae bacterium]
MKKQRGDEKAGLVASNGHRPSQEGGMCAREQAAAAYSRNERSVLAVCRHVTKNRQDAEDACQDVFLKLLGEEVPFPEEQDLDPWLCNVSFGIASNRRRSRQRRKKYEERCASCLAAQPLEEVIQHEIQDHVEAAISGVPETLRIPFVLHHLEGKSRSEVAHEL